MKLSTHLNRHRSLFLAGGSLLAIVASLLSDPDGGLSTALGALGMLQGVAAVALAHWGRKALTDYPESDMRLLFTEARKSPTGAGLALVALAMIFVGLLLVFAPRAHAAELPAGFYKYGPVLKAEQQRLWPAHPDPVLLAALVAHESACPLKRSCWNPGARLKSAREEGAGMGQVTRAYRKDGSTRFDALAGMKQQYGAELGGWSWDNVYQRPDLQLRAMVLQSRDLARTFRAAPAMLEFTDAGYNGGQGGVQKERRACQLAAGCDPGRWFGHVERHCLKSRQPIYGTRSACDINRHHVADVTGPRRAQYADAWRRL